MKDIKFKEWFLTGLVSGGLGSLCGTPWIPIMPATIKFPWRLGMPNSNPYQVEDFGQQDMDKNLVELGIYALGALIPYAGKIMDIIYNGGFENLI